MNPPARGPTSAVLVVGADGGCGASLVAGALALAWTREGRATWLVELDLDRGDRGEAWGVAHERTLADLAAVADELDEGHLRRAAHTRDDGLHLLLAPAVPGSSAPWSDPAVRRLLAAARDAAGDGGRVVLDGGVGLSPLARALVADVERVLVVCGATVAATRRARALVAASEGCGRSGDCGLAVVDVPSGGDIGPRAIGRVVGAPVLAELPWARADAARLAGGAWPPARRGRLAAAVQVLAEAVA